MHVRIAPQFVRIVDRQVRVFVGNHRNLRLRLAVEHQRMRIERGVAVRREIAIERRVMKTKNIVRQITVRGNFGWPN